MEGCVFCKIVRGEIPAEIVYQDEGMIVFKDIKPAAATHLLFVPKKHVGDLSELENETLIKIKEKILEKVSELKLREEGYRVIINGGAAMVVAHLHVHLLGGVDIARSLNK